MIPTPPAPTPVPVFHPLCNYTPHMVLHCSHVPVFQPFWWFRQVKSLRLVWQEPFPVILVIPDQFFHVLNLIIVTQTVPVNLQIPEYFFDLFFPQKF